MKNQTPEIVSLYAIEQEERTKLIQLIRLWGGIASDAVLNPACVFYTMASIEGLIGYRNEQGCAMVLGDPICSPDDLLCLTKSFHSYCQEQGKSVVYVSASNNFTEWAINQKLCQAFIEYGEELYVDPHHDPRKLTGNHASLVRRKVRHALHENTTVHEYLTNNPKLEEAMQQVAIEWLGTRRGPQIYISHMHLFENRLGKRWFYATQGDQIVGMLVLNELKSRCGWHLNHLMHTKSAPHGTPELLVVTAFEMAASEGAHCVTFGPVPLDLLGRITGFGKKSDWLMRKGYQIARKIFRLQGRKAFWEKFHPESQPSYLLFSQSSIGLRGIMGLIRGLNVGFT